MDKNYNVLQHMIEHCNKIYQYVHDVSQAGQEEFMNNDMLQDAVLVRLLSIGELTTHISEDFKAANNDKMDWRNIKQLRNIIAHRYGTIQFDVIWDIVVNDIPHLKKFCEEQLTEFEQADNKDDSPEK